VGGAALLALPIALSLLAYYPKQLAGAPWPLPGGDAAFYAYQLMRAAECHGQWWRVAEDSRLGHPYPTEFAKHPGLFEGVDLMLLATLTEGFLGAAATYHLAVIAVLAANGWLAAWIVWRATRSVLWAAVAATLITLNQPVSIRILGHLHLFKFGWAVLAVWVFAAFWKQPAWWRGLLVGLAAALALQGSFYLGFFTGLGLGFWYLAMVLAGRVGRRHGAATALALLAFVALAAAFCFPVWTGTSQIVASGRYFHREWYETWAYGSELWKYLVPKGSGLAESYFRDVRLQTAVPTMDEGWNFPGYTVLLAALVYFLSRLRTTGIHSRVGPFAAVGLGLMAFWTVLSLAGGPSALLYFVIPSFRCFGRSGLLVVGLGSVVAPIVLCELVRSRSRRLVRGALLLGLLILVASDARRAALSFAGWPAESKPPEWVGWLKRQPPGLRLAVFAKPAGDPFDWWGQDALRWLPLHGHATLNGADFGLFEGDLRLLGGSYGQINPAGLQLVASLGYQAFAFHRDYVAANSWIKSLPWLDRIEQRGDWLLCRAGPQLERLRALSLDQLLALGPHDFEPREAPPYCWITGSWPIAQDVVVTGADWAILTWIDDRGTTVSAPMPALYHHIFGPCVPAYSVRTPVRPGTYRLAICDRSLRPRATIGYRIVAERAVAEPTFPARPSRLTVHPVTLEAAGTDRSTSLGVTLVNTTSCYVQSLVFREFVDPVARTHPGLRSRWPRANTGGLVLRVWPKGGDPSRAEEAREIPLPEDLPPGGRLKVDLGPNRLPPSWASMTLIAEPALAGVGQGTESPEKANIKISVERQPRDIARLRPRHEARKR